MSNRQYIGARYVPKFEDEWVSGKSYEALTVVPYLNASYTSKKPVPANIGNPSANPDYWAPTGNYNAQIESMMNTRYYVTPEMFGATGDGIHDDYSAIQQAMDTKKPVVFTNEYFVSETLLVKGDIYFTNEGKIKTASSGLDYTPILYIHNQSNLTIINPILDGGWNGSGNKDGTDEYSDGIGIGNSSNIKVVGGLLTNLKGDGINFTDHGTSNTNIIIDGTVVNNVYRNIISLVNVCDSAIKNVVGYKTNDYVAGIDLEPNASSDQIVHNVTFDNCYINTTDVAGFNFFGTAEAGYSGYKIDNITIRNCNVISSNNYAIYGGASYSEYVGRINIINSRLNSETYCGSILLHCKGNVFVDNCEINGDSTSSTGMPLINTHGNKIMFTNNTVNCGNVQFSFSGNNVYIDNNNFHSTFVGSDSLQSSGIITVYPSDKCTIIHNNLSGGKGGIYVGAFVNSNILIFNNSIASVTSFDNASGIIIISDNGESIGLKGCTVLGNSFAGTYYTPYRCINITGNITPLDYKVGDNFSIDYVTACSGYQSNDGTDIVFCYPLCKQINDNVTAYISGVTLLANLHTGSFNITSKITSISGVTVNNVLKITAHLSSAIDSNVTNDVCLTAMFKGTIAFT